MRWRFSGRSQSAGHPVVRLTRTAAVAGESVFWDPARGQLDAAALAGVGAVVHLAGAPVDERWTAERKRQIRSSRIDGTALLARTIAGLRPAPAVFLSASAIGFLLRGNRVPQTVANQKPASKSLRP